MLRSSPSSVFHRRLIRYWISHALKTHEQDACEIAIEIQSYHASRLVCSFYRAWIAVPSKCWSAWGRLISAWSSCRYSESPQFAWGKERTTQSICKKHPTSDIGLDCLQRRIKRSSNPLIESSRWRNRTQTPNHTVKRNWSNQAFWNDENCADRDRCIERRQRISKFSISRCKRSRDNWCIEEAD